MSIRVWHYERRDDADREALGKNALALTQAVRAADGIRTSKFYWANPDTIVVMNDVEDGVPEAPPSPEAARALFAMSDLARLTRSEQWIDPRVGERTYREAGR